jgi:predicted small lipoprotein YifL
MAKKILAILLALTFVVAFAACGGKGDDVTTTAPAETTADPFEEVETEAPATEIATEAPAVDESEVAVSDPTEAPAADETTVAASEEATTEAANAMPEGKEAIVAYYNTAINNAKKNSKSIHSNYMKHAVAGEITGIPSALDSVGQSLIKDNMGEDDSKKNVTWTSAEDKNAFFPVEGETYASKLTAADVKDAKIVEKDGKWIIRITTVADPRSEGYSHSNGHAPKAFNAVLPGIIDGYIPGIAKSLFSVGTVATGYPSSTVQVTVDPATGNVTHANYMLYWTLYIPLSGTDVVLPFSTENDYNINW